MWAITRRELAGYFNSPVAYVFIVIFLLLNGFFTFGLGYYFERGQASLAEPFFSWHPWLYLFLVPAVGMRLWAEERRSGTLELLLTMPIAPWQAIVGKFLASWIFLGIALVLTFPIVITTAYLGDPDNGAVIAGYLGSLLLAGAYLGVTELMSAITRNQIIAFIIAVVVCFFLILCGWEPVTQFLVNHLPDGVVALVKGLSTWHHFLAFQRGVVDFRDLLYFGSVIGFSLFATSVVLRGVRGA
jgi:ABC-2 type transport system permease protein